jgi:RNA polymerase sigma factor (sigma-70 family)
MGTATNRLRLVLGNLRSSFDTLSDGQLLTRFVTARDEAAFAALVRRHGPMVLGVCRRVLQHLHDAEDVFQATFLVLARKAHAVVQREAISGWLYCVAYRTAQEARAMRARRRAKEWQVEHPPEPESPAGEPQDWRPMLDEELSRLPQKYQSPLVLCDLEARTRKEAACQLGIPEGTLSSRLAKARRMLAARLARRGVMLSAGALGAALAEGAVSAQVSGPLVADTAKVAVLVAAGQLATLAAPVAVLMKGVMQAMLIAKLRLIVGLFVGAALIFGLGSVAYQMVGAQNPPAAGPAAAKPANELEALRKENELLKLNLLVVLEKVRAQEAELRALREKKKEPVVRNVEAEFYYGLRQLAVQELEAKKAAAGTTTLSLEDAVHKLRGATTDEGRREAADALDRVVQRLRQELGQRKGEPPAKK